MIRLFLLAGAVLAVAGAAYKLRGTLRPTHARLPEWSFHDMPLEFGEWQGEKTALDADLFRAIDADVVSDRLYRNERGDVVSVHTAAFTEYDFGVQHNPIVCYRTHGWEMSDAQELDLDVGDDKTIPVKLITWTRERRRVMTLYWYQLGEEVLFDRGGLGRARLKLLGQEAWPALLKVLMETPALSPVEAEGRLTDLARPIYRWINGPHPERPGEPEAPGDRPGPGAEAAPVEAVPRSDAASHPCKSWGPAEFLRIPVRFVSNPG